jgi:MarR family transcriptional regulator, organic hydroperoxide resistance regulator
MVSATRYRRGMADRADEPFSPLLFRTLAKTYKAVNADLTRRLEGHGVHPGQDYVLEQLWREDGQPVGVLAERVGIEVPTLVRTLTRMEAAGLVRREADPQDRRRVRVVLTDRGRELERIVPPILAEATEAATAGLPERQRDQLVRLLREVQENLAG